MIITDLFSSFFSGEFDLLKMKYHLINYDFEHKTTNNFVPYTQKTLLLNAKCANFNQWMIPDLFINNKFIY